MQSSGLADAAHAQHIHIGGNFKCPSPSAAQNNEPTGILSTPEGKPAYGGIKVSLTKSGKTGADSALAVDRMPSGTSYEYQRTIDVSEDTVQSLKQGNAVIVNHGIAPSRVWTRTAR